MNTVYFDKHVDDDRRRRDLYEGHLYVYSPSPATDELCELAREMCEEAFAPYLPVDAQYMLPVDRYNDILKTLKPAFIHDPRCKELIREILNEKGCDLDRTYFDVPRLRTATSDGYLTSGLAYAFKPHRDTWYSPPRCQINWWLPVYEIESENAMAFHTHYWNRPLKNSSSEFNYQDWNVDGRKAAHKQGTQDKRRQSEALEPVELDPQLRLVTKPGGMIAFSAAHLHSTVPNTSGRTRISIDFRTVHFDELVTNSGAPNLDSACTGTTIGDYLRASDFSHVPDRIQDEYHKLETSCAQTSLVPN
ncbi:MAG: hypothetical protein JJ911_11305 [Rhizobiaceae bacterium]|nr:hypothetical protein [Rhizobiaceae bacterium]